jgi:hypothetical protein
MEILNQKGEGNLMLWQNVGAKVQSESCIFAFLRELLPAPPVLNPYLLSPETPIFKSFSGEQTAFFRALQHGRYPFLTALLLPNYGAKELFAEENFADFVFDFYIPAFELLLIFAPSPPAGLEAHCRTRGITLFFAEQAKFLMPIFEAHLQKKQYSEELLRYEKENEGHNIFSPETLAVLRYRLKILLISLCENDLLNSEQSVWKISLRSEIADLQKEIKFALEDIAGLAHLAEQVLAQKCCFRTDKILFTDAPDALKIDFSLFKRPDETHSTMPETIFVRNSPFHKTKFYYRNLNKELTFRYIPESNYFYQASSQKFISEKISAEKLPMFLKIMTLSNPFIQSNLYEFLPALNDFLNGKNVLCEGGFLLSTFALTSVFLADKAALILCPDDAHLLVLSAQMKRFSPAVGFYEGLSDDEINRQKAETAAGKYRFVLMTADFILRQEWEKNEEFIHFSRQSVLLIESFCGISAAGYDFKINLNFAYEKLSNTFPSMQKVAFFTDRRQNVVNDLLRELAADKVYFTVLGEKMPIFLQQTNGKAYTELLSWLKKIPDDESVLVLTQEAEGNKGAFLLAERLSYDLKTEVGFYAEKTPPEMRLRESEFELLKKRQIEEWVLGSKKILTARYDFAPAGGFSANRICFYGVPPCEDYIFLFSEKNTAPDISLFFTPDEPEILFEAEQNAQNPVKLREIVDRAAWMKNDVLHILGKITQQYELPEEDAVFCKNLIIRILHSKNDTFSVSELDYRMFSGHSIKREKITADAVFRLKKGGFFSKIAKKDRETYDVRLSEKISQGDTETLEEEISQFCAEFVRERQIEKVQNLLRFCRVLPRESGEYFLNKIEKHDYYEDLRLLFRHFVAEKSHFALTFERLLQEMQKNRHDLTYLQSIGEYAQGLRAIFANSPQLAFAQFFLQCFLQHKSASLRNCAAITLFFTGENVFETAIKAANMLEEEFKSEFCVLLCAAYPEKIAEIYERCRDFHSLQILTEQLAVRLKKTADILM